MVLSRAFGRHFDAQTVRKSFRKAVIDIQRLLDLTLLNIDIVYFPEFKSCGFHQMLFLNLGQGIPEHGGLLVVLLKLGCSKARLQSFRFLWKMDVRTIFGSAWSGVLVAIGPIVCLSLVNALAVKSVAQIVEEGADRPVNGGFIKVGTIEAV